MLRDVPIKVVLLLSFLVAGIIPLMAVAMLSRDAARVELERQAMSQLESVRELKAAELGRFFEDAARRVEVLAADPSTVTALMELEALVNESGGVEALSLKATGNGSFQANERYRALHQRHYSYLKRYAEGHGFYDVFLMTPSTGFTLLTVLKEADFGVHIADTESGLKDVFEVARVQRRASISDTRPYGPSGDAPAQFVAAPILVEGELLGVVAVQISIDAIDRVMGERSGMGRTGEAYLVGSDFRMRSDSYRAAATHSVVASFRGSVLENGADTASVRAALSGLRGGELSSSFDGRTVLSAYAPLDFDGVRWAIVAELDAQEVEDRIAEALDTELLVSIGLSTVLLIVLAVGVSMLSSGGIARVVGELGSLIDKVLEGGGYERLDPEELPVDFRGVALKTNELASALVQQTKERQQLEEVLQYNQRMESIGTLAGGIAHDFNNLLTYLGTYVELIIDELPEDSAALTHVEQIGHGIERASELVSQIMLFSRQMKRERRPVNLSIVVKEAVKLLKATLPPTIRVAKQLGPEPLYVLAEPTQLHQVVMNLCTNAFHAMLRTGGVLELRLERRSFGAGEYPVWLEQRGEGGSKGHDGGSASSRHFCVLTVSDTGEGIEPAIRERVFEPFFTTKPMGQGTGMGLAVVHGIVSAHHGHIQLESQPQQGTTVQVFLPLEERPVTEASRDAEPSPVRGSGRLLLVDDERSICDALSSLIASLGYQVEAHSDSVEALSVFERDPMRFDLVLTDLSMPELDGAALARRLKALRPELPLLLMTGYSELLGPGLEAELGAAGVLMKPFRRYALSVALRDALMSQSNGG